VRRAEEGINSARPSAWIGALRRQLKDATRSKSRDKGSAAPTILAHALIIVSTVYSTRLKVGIRTLGWPIDIVSLIVSCGL
jgi:hypothetical protein